MMCHQLPDVFRALDREVIAQPRGDQHFFNSFDLASSAIQIDQRCLIGIEILANARVDAAQFAACRFCRFVFAGEPPHIGGWPA